MADPVVEQTPGGVRITLEVPLEAEQDDEPAESSGAADVARAVVGAVVGTAAAVAGAALRTIWDAIKPDDSTPPAPEEE